VGGGIGNAFGAKPGASGENWSGNCARVGEPGGFRGMFAVRGGWVFGLDC
jgi:hypothetical protein